MSACTPAEYVKVYTIVRCVYVSSWLICSHTKHSTKEDNLAKIFEAPHKEHGAWVSIFAVVREASGGLRCSTNYESTASYVRSVGFRGDSLRENV